MIFYSKNRKQLKKLKSRVERMDEEIYIIVMVDFLGLIVSSRQRPHMTHRPAIRTGAVGVSLHEFDLTRDSVYQLRSIYAILNAKEIFSI